MTHAQDRIIHDGEFQFLRQQHGERWDAEDREVDKMLTDIRTKHGGKRPKIFYILIDDVRFGQMGNRTLNYVTGIKTPSINKLAEEGLSLMRMYTEPSCTPTRAAILTGRHPVRTGLKEGRSRLSVKGFPPRRSPSLRYFRRPGHCHRKH